jgi:hypothetical protein
MINYENENESGYVKESKIVLKYPTQYHTKMCLKYVWYFPMYIA